MFLYILQNLFKLKGSSSSEQVCSQGMFFQSLVHVVLFHLMVASIIVPEHLATRLSILLHNFLDSSACSISTRPNLISILLILLVNQVGDIVFGMQPLFLNHAVFTWYSMFCDHYSNQMEINLCRGEATTFLILDTNFPQIFIISGVESNRQGATTRKLSKLLEFL